MNDVDKLLEQYCYKSAVGLLQLVRFYVCSCKLVFNCVPTTCYRPAIQQLVNKM
jgi:hypothetical protein